VTAVHVAAGLGLAIAASLALETGYVLQAGESRAHGVAARRSTLLAALARRRRWIAGSALAAAGALLQLAALAVAPVALVQPALLLGLGLLVVLAERRLGEVARRSDRIAVGLAGVGVTLVAVGGVAQATGPADGRVPALAALLAVLSVAAAGGLGAGRTRALVATAAAADASAVLAGKLAVDALSHGGARTAGLWLAAAATTAIVGLTAEMAALQRLPATVVGPLVLAAQVAVPVLLAPAVVGERWSSVPLVALGALVATAAAALLGRAREELTQAAPRTASRSGPG